MNTQLAPERRRDAGEEGVAKGLKCELQTAERALQGFALKGKVQVRKKKQPCEWQDTLLLARKVLTW